jgi:hypothetical protein
MNTYFSDHIGLLDHNYEPVQSNPKQVTQTEPVVTAIPITFFSDHWDELHRYVYTTPEKAEVDHLEWMTRIPNAKCSCLAEWKRLIALHPPDFSSARAFFEWGVDRHNDVNVLLGKPIFTLKEALQKHKPIRTFTTISDLNNATLSLLKKIPPIRGVAGVPVSGLLVAPTIATLLHVPLYEVSEQHGLVKTGHGWRGCSRIADSSLPLLVVDDTVSSGRSIGLMRDRLKADGVNNCLFASSLCHGNSLDKVDLYGSQCDEPHLLEWNLANSGYMSTLGHHGLHGAGIVCDMDGVICQDPPRHFDETNDDDRDAYLRWLADAPLGTFLPRMHDVPVIVSWRCEYTRSLTEHWLRRHHIKYKRLVLWGDNSQKPAEQSASRTWQPLDHKGRILLEANYAMIVESCEHQSRAICEATGKSVLCWDAKEYFNPKI